MQGSAYDVVRERDAVAEILRNVQLGVGPESAYFGQKELT